MNHIIGVLTPTQRDNVLQSLLHNYTLRYAHGDAPSKFLVVKNKLNQITIFEKLDPASTSPPHLHPLHTVTVVVVPIVLNLQPLESLRGEKTKFSFGVLFDELDRLKNSLKNLIDNPQTPKEELTRTGILNRVIRETWEDGEKT
jgi:hypothetical protein